MLSAGMPMESFSARSSPLRNVGNSCFINSTLQALFCLGSVRECISKSEFADELLIRVMQEAIRTPSAVYEPRIVVGSAECYKGVQDDAHVFYLTLLRRLGGGLRSKLFAGSIASRFACGTCSDESFSASEDIVSLSVSLLDDHGGLLTTTSAALTNYSKCVRGVQKECCSFVCKGASRSVSKSTIVLSTPEILVLQLKRWSSDGALLAHRVSADDVVEFGGRSYRLRSIVYHEGRSPAAGHYYSLCSYRDESTRHFAWWCYNDSVVSSSCQDAISGNTYLVIYERDPAVASRRFASSPINLGGASSSVDTAAQQVVDLESEAGDVTASTTEVSLPGVSSSSKDCVERNVGLPDLLSSIVLGIMKFVGVEDAFPVVRNFITPDLISFLAVTPRGWKDAGVAPMSACFQLNYVQKLIRLRLVKGMRFVPFGVSDTLTSCGFADMLESLGGDMLTYDTLFVADVRSMFAPDVSIDAGRIDKLASLINGLQRWCHEHDLSSLVVDFLSRKITVLELLNDFQDIGASLVADVSVPVSIALGELRKVLAISRSPADPSVDRDTFGSGRGTIRTYDERADCLSSSTESLSDLSDCSADTDVFHVQPRQWNDPSCLTFEDSEFMRIDALSVLLRDRPLLPPDKRNA